MSHEEATRASSTRLMCNAPPNSCRSWVEQEYLVGHREIPTKTGMLWTIDIYFYDVDLEAQARNDENMEEETYTFIQRNVRGKGNISNDQEADAQEGTPRRTDETSALTQVRLRSVSRSPPRSAMPTRFQTALVHRWGTENPIEIPLRGTPQNAIKQHILEHMLGTGQINSITRTLLHIEQPNPPGNTRQNKLVILREEMQDKRQGRVLIILDIDVIPSAADRIHTSMNKREVLYVNSRSDRATWLQQVGMRPYCTGDDDQCLVLARGQLWDSQDTATKNHDDGDYFMISLPHPEGPMHFDEMWQRDHPGQTTHATPHCEASAATSQASSPTSEDHSLLQGGKETHKKRGQEEDDATNLMMQVRPNQQRRFRDAQVFREGDEGPIFVQTSDIEPDDILQHLHKKLGSTRNQKKYQNSRFHEVYPKPEDLKYTGSLVLIQESKEDVKEGQVIILLDYVILQDTTGPHVTVGRDGWRETKYIRKISSRREWITEIGMSQFCPEAYDRCLVTMEGRTWKAQDDTRWNHNEGAYARIIAPQPSQRIPFSQFWQCTQRGTTTADAWLRAQIQFEQLQQQERTSSTQNYNRQQDDRDPQRSASSNTTSSSYSGIDEAAEEPQTAEEDQEQMTIIQIKTKRRKHRNQSFAAHAKARLPPPGNGHKKQKKVTFSNKIQVQAHDGKRNTEKDMCITNGFIQRTYQAFSGETENPFWKGYTWGIRKGKAEKEPEDAHSQTILLQHYLPLDEQNTKDRQHLEMQQVLKELRKDFRAKFVLKNNWEDIKGLHDLVKEHLAQQQAPCDQKPRAIHIYTDGSQCQDKDHNSFAAWAFTVELEYEGPNGSNYLLIGYEAASLQRSQLSDLFIGEEHFDSMEAEACAIFWALGWIAAWKDDCEIDTVLHVDCMAALYASSADWRIPVRMGQPCKISQKARYLAQLLEAEGRKITYEHIKAHEGALGNEAADSVARSIARGNFGPMGERSPWIKQLAMHKDLKHIWMEAESTRMPRKGDPNLMAKGDQTRREVIQDIKQDYVKDIPREEEAHIMANVATINVFSGLDKNDQGMITRRACLAEQFFNKKWHIIAIQESRYRQSILKSNDKYLMYTASATKAGQLGVELWFDRQTKIGTSRIKPEHIIIQGTSPSKIEASLRHPQLQFDIMAVHAPQRDDPKADEWWDELRDNITKKARNGKPLILLGDCNSRLGSEYSTAIGRKDPERECKNGHRLRRLLDECQLWAINTHDDTHQGSSWTYHQSRIDYIVSSASWAHCFAATWIDDDIDLMHAKEDHKPLVGQLKYSTKSMEHQQANKAKYNTKAAHDPANKEKVVEIFNKFPAPGWMTSIDEHVHALNKHLQAELAQQFPALKNKPFQPFIGEDTWAIIQSRKELQKEIRKCKKDEKMELLQQCFRWWKGERWAPIWHNRDQYMAVTQQALVNTSLTLKKQLKKDKEQFLQQQMEQLEDAIRHNNAKEIYKALRTFRPQTPRQRIKVPRPLPTLKGDDGLIADKAGWNRAWLDHWKRIECAYEIPYEQHIEEAIDEESQIECLEKDIQEALPCLSDVEKILHRLKRNKAPGQDGITSDIFKQGGSAAARVIYEIAAKQLARGAVPILHRGSEAVPLYKAKGPMESRNSYRSIALQCSLAKIMSRTWRTEIEQAMTRIANTRQGGARASLGPNAHITRIRCIQDLAAKQKTSFGLAVMDLESAFYKTVRGFITEVEGEPRSAETVAHLFKQLGLAPTLFDEFMDEIAGTTMLKQGRTNKAVERVVSSMMKGAWARLPGDDKVMIPMTGTKPGDPLADILFSMVMVKYITNVEKRLKHSLPNMKGMMMTWIDDIAVPFMAPAAHLIETATTIITILFEEAVKMGLKPTLKKGKSEILLAFHGTQAQTHKRACEEGDQKISFNTEHCGQQQVDIVEELEYLGALIDRQDSTMPEIRRNTSRAMAAVKPLKKAILTNPQVNTKQKVGILNALGMSRVTYTAGTWKPLRQTESNLWHARIMALYRLTIPRAQQEQHISDLQVRATLAVNSPEDMIKSAVVRQVAMMAKWADEEYLEPFLQLDDMAQEGTWTTQCVDVYNDMQRHQTHWKGPMNNFRELITHYQGERGKRDLDRLVKAFQKRQKHVQQQEWEIKHKHAKGEKTGKQGKEKTLECRHCGMTFLNETARAVHQRHKHQRYAEAAPYAPGTVCFICTRQFFTRARLVQHLQYGSSGCLERIKGIVHPMTAQQVEDLCRLDNEKIREAKESGRRTREQKRTFVQDGYNDFEELVGWWNTESSISVLSDEEVQEKERLLRWELDVDILAYCEEIEDPESQETIYRLILERAQNVSSRVQVWWLYGLEQSIRNLYDSEKAHFLTAGIFKQLRYLLIDPALNV